MSKPQCKDYAVVKVEDMQPEMRVNCIVRIVRPIMSGTFSTLNGTKVRVMEIEVADETGSIRLRLINSKNKQANVIML